MRIKPLEVKPSRRFQTRIDREKIQTMFRGDPLAQYYATAIMIIERKKNKTEEDRGVLAWTKKEFSK